MYVEPHCCLASSNLRIIEWAKEYQITSDFAESELEMADNMPYNKWLQMLMAVIMERAFWGFLTATGGTESCIDAVSLGGFGRMRALAVNYNEDPDQASRPFDASRCGFVMGEGAGIMILEDLSHAQKRGASIIAEVSHLFISFLHLSSLLFRI